MDEIYKAVYIAVYEQTNNQEEAIRHAEQAVERYLRLINSKSYLLHRIGEGCD